MYHASTIVERSLLLTIRSLPTSAQSLILSISPKLLKKQSLDSLMTIWPVMIYMCPFSPHIGVATAQSQL